MGLRTWLFSGIWLFSVIEIFRKNSKCFSKKFQAFMSPVLKYFGIFKYLGSSMGYGLENLGIFEYLGIVGY